MRALFRKIVGFIGLAAILLPLLALVAASLTDQRAGGPARPTLVPLALVLLDPLQMEAYRNSLGIALLVSILSTGVGFLLARASLSARFLGRSVLLLLAALPASTLPLVGALGLRCYVSSFGLDSPPLRPDEGLGRITGPPDPRWIALVWAQVAFLAPWAGWRLASALRRIQPAWVDVSRSAGLGGGVTWRRLVWPLIRPAMARVVSSAFVVSLVEPGAPLVLGIRRTLAWQIVEGARRAGPGDLNRIAILALLCLWTCLATRWLVRGWGTSRFFLSMGEPVERPEAVVLPLGMLASRLGLALWSIVSLVPLSGLILLAGRIENAEAGLLQSFDLFTFQKAMQRALGDPALPGALILGLAAILPAWLLAVSLALGESTVRRARGLLSSVPSVVLATGILALPSLALAIDALGSRVQLPPFASATLRGFAALPMDPRVTAAVPLVYGLSLTQTTWAMVALRQARRSVPASLVEIARVIGCSRFTIRWRILRPLIGPSLVMGSAVVGLLGAIGLGPGLILRLTLDPSPLGPTLVDRLATHNGLQQAVGPALLMQFAGLAMLPALASWQGDLSAGAPTP